MRSAAAVLSLLAAASLGGCASRTPHGAAPIKFPELTAAPDYTITNGRTGEPVTMGELVDAAAAADAVLLGELHGQADGQAFEGTFFRALLAKAPTTIAALEFFERDQQAGVDDFLKGVTDEAGFWKATLRGPGSYTAGHRDIILASRDAGRPVIAANAPRRYVKIARAEGFARLGGLTSEQTRLFNVPEQMPGGGYEQRFIDLMAPADEKGERPGKADAEAMFRSQSVWDATMAASVAGALGANAGRPVVLVIGKFHVESEGGTAQMLARARPGARVVTVTMQERNNKEDESPTSGPPADYIVLVPNTESPEFSSSR